MDEKDRQRFLEEIWPAAEQAARARGMSDEEIAEKRKQALDMLEHAPKRGEAGFPQPESSDGDTEPVDRLPSSVFGGSPPVRLAFHRNVLRLVMVGLFAVLGYFGMPGMSGGHLWHEGVRGLVYGTALGLGLLVFAETLARTRRGGA